MKKSIRHLSIPVRMNKEEYNLIYKAAKKTGKKRSMIIRDGAIREAFSIINF